MKEFYSIIACALMGSALTASAEQLPWHTKELKNAPRHQITELRTVDQKLKKPSIIEKSISGVVSREDEGVDICSFSQCLYADFIFNWFDSGEQLSQARGLMSSNEVEIVYNGDETFSIKNFFDISVFSPTLYIEDNQLVMHLGEELFVDGYGNKYILISADNETGELIDEGTLPIDVYTDAIKYDGFLGVYALGPDPGLFGLSTYTVFVAPNATLKYKYQMTDEYGDPAFDEDGNPLIYEVNNKVYAEYNEAAPQDGQMYDEIWISNVMPWNSGVGVSFSFFDEEGLNLLVAFDQIVMPSQWTGTEYTGDFYLSGIYSQLEDQIDTTVLADSDNDAMYWPGKDESLGIFPDQWLAISLTTGYSYQPFDPATLLFYIEDDNNGIIDINNEEYEGAPEYYNIQGMRISNPQAGQFCIVKEGSKTTKTIVR